MTAIHAEHLDSHPTVAQVERERQEDDAYYRGLAGTMPGCAPWCAYHAYIEGWSEPPGICYSGSPGPDADVLLSDEHGGSGSLLMHWEGGEPVDLEKAEAFARKVLALVELARTDGGAA